jgi:hypothetical protein
MGLIGASHRQESGVVLQLLSFFVLLHDFGRASNQKQTVVDFRVFFGHYIR